MTTRLALCGVIVGLSAVAPATAEDKEPQAYLQFASRDEHVELEKTRGALDLEKPFTIEIWAKWDTGVLDKPLTLAGDEVWPKMHKNLSVTGLGGWVIRTTPVRDADKQAVEFNVAATDRGKTDWLGVRTDYQKVDPKKWQHIAVCRTAQSELKVYWNGKVAARKALGRVALHSSPSNVFLGVRKDAFEDREFQGEIHAFRLSSKAVYDRQFTPEVPAKADDSTVALLHLTAVEDGRVTDLSGNKHDGSVAGAKLVKAK